MDYISKAGHKKGWAKLVVQPSIGLHETSTLKE